MPYFRFHARTWDGLVEEGTVEAASLYDFYADMNERQLKVEKVVDVTGLQPVPPPPTRRWWPLPIFIMLQLLLIGLVIQFWLPLPFRTTMLLLPALAAQTLVALLAWQRARPGPLLGPHLVTELSQAPLWFRLFTALLLALALAQFSALLGQRGLSAPPMVLAVRGLLAIGSLVAIQVTASGLAAAMRGRLS